MQGGFLLDIVIAEGSAVLKLLAGEDEALLVWGDTLLILNLRLDVVDGIRRLHLKGDGLASHYSRDCQFASFETDSARLCNLGEESYLRVLTKICMVMAVRMGLQCGWVERKCGF